MVSERPRVTRATGGDVMRKYSVLFLGVLILAGFLTYSLIINRDDFSDGIEKQASGTKGLPNSNKTTETAFDETLERYYDYFDEHQEIIPLLESNESGFTDALLATSAIMRFSEYNGDDGITREELNAITRKYFGREIQNFRNGRTEIDPQTGQIIVAGFSYDSHLHMVLKSLKDNGDGTKTAEFYALNISDSFWSEENILTMRSVKSNLLAGDFASYGKPDIVEIVFQEIDTEGDYYLRFLSIKTTATDVSEMIPYHR